MAEKTNDEEVIIEEVVVEYGRDDEIVVEEIEIIEDGKKEFRIQIDRAHYEVSKSKLTGEEIRHIPTPHIGPDRDLYEVVPGGDDLKIEANDVVHIKNGERFFTAPAHINPGNED